MSSMSSRFQSVFKGAGRGGRGSRESAADRLTSQGFHIDSHGVNVGATPGGAPIYEDIDSVAQRQFGSSNGQSLLSQAGQGLGYDIDFLEKNVQQPYQQNTDALRQAV